MADPLLTSLCVICHVSPPQYKCPRCGIRTCSLPCIKKHKAWSECSGERDATAYLAPSKLRTPAGVDHDYNFLHGIERSVERAERVLVGDKALVQPEELHPLTVQEVKWKPGRDGRKRKVILTRVLREAKGRVFERFLAMKLRKLNVDIVCAPMGMARQRENHTTLNRKTGRVNWQVEWLAFDENNLRDDKDEPKTTRGLSKVMDDTPLYQAYDTLLEERAKADGSLQPRRFIRPHQEAQSSSDSTWDPTHESLQDPLGQAWISTRTLDLEMWPSEKDIAQRKRAQYFLAKLRTRSDLPTELISVAQDDCFRTILANSQVLEFPTIYVLKTGHTLPEGFVAQQKPSTSKTRGTKRKNGPASKKKGQGPDKRRRRQDKANGLEEGEVGSDNNEEGDDNSGDNDYERGNKGSVGLEPGEVIAEQSFGEEDDDSTSSSGTDSEGE